MKDRNQNRTLPKKALHLCIVGGGSSGWMTAAYLAGQFKIDGKTLSVTLIESAEVPKTGVGEATIHTIRAFLQDCRIAEDDFIKAAQATFKHGIEFVGWSSHATSYFHPFETPPHLDPDAMALHYLKANRNSGPAAKYDNWAGMQSRVARKGVSPRAKGDRPYQSSLPYGYHLDANAFAHFLKKTAIKRGVRHKVAHVDDVIVDGDQIEALRLKTGETITADLWLDCTGFAARLISAVGGEFKDFSEQLLVDAAVTCQITSDDLDLRPFTTATARTSGWTFDIDLQKRGGRGYVYSSAFQTEDQAFDEFSAAYPGLIDEARAKTFQLKVGRMQKPWIGNCCSVGLAAGFLEPMESTGLYFVEFAARVLSDALDSWQGTAKDQHVTWFNTAFNELFDEVAAFIEAHYKFSDRRDTEFWRAATAAAPSPKLAELLTLWQHRLPSRYDFSAHSFFQPESWQAILFGLGWRPTGLRRLDSMDLKTSLKHYKTLEAHAERFAIERPRHKEYHGVEKRSALRV